MIKLRAASILLMAIELGIGSRVWAADITLPENNSRYYRELGESCARHGLWDDARKQLLESIRLNQFDLLSLYDLGIVCARQGNLNQALEYEKQAIAINEKYIPAHLELAWILVQKKDVNSAEKILRKAMEIDPNNVDVRNSLEAITKGQDMPMPIPPLTPEVIS